jgi:alanine dehydrogenase
MATTKPFISSSFSYETLEEKLDVKPKGESLSIGIPTETSFNENRIPLTPEAVSVLIANGHEVVIESKAGMGSNYSDNDYSEAGARIIYDKKEIFNCNVIVKSAPVSEEDCEFLKPNTNIISPIHMAIMKKSILEKMMAKKVTAISFENLKDDSGHNPIVRSMSEIAGSAVMLIAGQYLSNANNGKGVLVGGISGIPPTKVIIIGAGIVGEYAARTALALGANVKVFDNSIYRLKRLQNNIGVRMWTSVIEPKILSKQLKTCDVAIGALSGAAGRTPVVVSEDMVIVPKAELYIEPKFV